MHPLAPLVAEAAHRLRNGADHAVRAFIAGTFERLTGETAKGTPERLVRDLWARELLHDDAALYLLALVGAVRTVGGPLEVKVRTKVAAAMRALPAKAVASIAGPLLRRA